MTSPNVMMNPFFQQNQKPFVDPVSKVYIGVNVILGLNRLPAILNKGKYIFTSLAVLYSIFLSYALINSMYLYMQDVGDSIPLIMNFTEYIFCVTYSFISWKRIERYYDELNTFDVEIGCRPKVTIQAVTNLILTMVFCVILPLVVLLSAKFGGGQDIKIYVIPLFLLHFLELLELHYYGHLLDLLVSRLRLISYFVEITLSHEKIADCPNIDEFVSFKGKYMKNTTPKKLMDLYHITIKAYDFLNDAIKWQVLKYTFYNFFYCLVS